MCARGGCVTAVAKSAGEARPREIAKTRATTESELAVSAGQLGLLGEARPLGKSATTKPELAESSGGVGRNWIFLVQSWWHDQSCRSAQDLVPGQGRGRQKYPSGAKF